MNTLLLTIITSILFSGHNFKSELNNYLNQKFNNYKNYEYTIVKFPKNYKKIEILKNDRLNVSGGFAYVPVKIISKNKRIVRSFITVHVKLFKQVLVANNPIKRFDSLEPSEFTSKIVDVSKVIGKLIIQPSILKNYRSKIEMKAGTILTSEIIEKTPIIKIGDHVKANYFSGNVAITLNAIARQDGVVGETITIMTDNSKQFRAKVVNSKQVIIE